MIASPAVSRFPRRPPFWAACCFCCASRADNFIPLRSTRTCRPRSRREAFEPDHTFREPTMAEHLIIFDTTLRDGEQSPGASMTNEEKMRIAKQLERLRVDVIEAGFPASSNGDWAAVHAIAAAIKDSTVCGLARANDHDIERCGEAIRPAKSGRIHTFLATSPIHMQMKLRMTPEQVFESAIRAVRHARQYTDDVEFS